MLFMFVLSETDIKNSEENKRSNQQGNNAGSSEKFNVWSGPVIGYKTSNKKFHDYKRKIQDPSRSIHDPLTVAKEL